MHDATNDAAKVRPIKAAPPWVIARHHRGLLLAGWSGEPLAEPASGQREGRSTPRRAGGCPPGSKRCAECGDMLPRALFYDRSAICKPCDNRTRVAVRRLERGVAC